MNIIKTPLLPEEPLFQARPTRLMEAVSELPESKGPAPQPRRKIQNLRQKLLQIPIEKLKKWKLKPSMLVHLPLLASETQNTELSERVLVLSIGNIGVFKPQTIAELLHFYLEHAVFRKTVLRLFRKRSVPPKMPFWIKEYWEPVFSSERPVEKLVQMLKKEGLLLHLVLSRSEIPATAPLANKLMFQYFAAMSQAELKEQPFVPTLNLLQKNMFPDLGQGLLRWMLHRYGETIDSPIHLTQEEPLVPLYELAVFYWGSTDRSGWSDFSPIIKRVGRWVWVKKELRRIFGQDIRSEWWNQYLRDIQNISCHRPSGTVAIDLGHWVALEFLATPHRCSLYRASDFRAKWSLLRWKRTQLHLPPAQHEIDRLSNWKSELSSFLS
ncbi:MAG: hypothetical protein CMK59_14045 [Proteobacteria bacterium]|nr:hypothetical protein [Pseudomonadota bacterium]